jgi:aryl-alcohol dehydrogenase-like predicted oxidoreductase
MGLLTGKFTEKSQLGRDDVRGIQPEWLRYFDQGTAKREWLERVRKVRQVLTRDGRTLTQAALGWIWARSPTTIPIPGFRTVKQVEENVGALRFEPLSQAMMNEIAEELGAA